MNAGACSNLIYFKQIIFLVRFFFFYPSSLERNVIIMKVTWLNLKCWNAFVWLWLGLWRINAQINCYITSFISWWTSLRALRTCSRLSITRFIWFLTTFLLQPASFVCDPSSLFVLCCTHVWFWPRFAICSEFGLGFLRPLRVVVQPTPLWGTSVEKMSPFGGLLKPSTGGSLKADRSFWLCELLLCLLM